jgi:hypothetical protein
MRIRFVKFNLPSEKEKAVRWLFKKRNPLNRPKQEIEDNLTLVENFHISRGIFNPTVFVGSYRTK